MIKIGDHVRALESVDGLVGEGAVGKVIYLEDGLSATRFDHITLWVRLDKLALTEPPLDRVIDSDQPPPASQDWTPHDRYTAAALTGLLANGGDTTPGGFVKVARLIADEAMTARGGE